VNERPIRLPVGAGSSFYIQAAAADSINMDNATRHTTMVSSTEQRRDWVNVRSATEREDKGNFCIWEICEDKNAIAEAPPATEDKGAMSWLSRKQ
jgi:hypothetical protein